MSVTQRREGTGQVLVLFVLILVALLGLSALAVDYGVWLLKDREFQNAADSAALAGAAEFNVPPADRSCINGTAPMCANARTRAWASLKDSLDLCAGLDPAACDTQLATYTTRDTPPAGDPINGWTLWVDTPPGGAGSSYTTQLGGRYAANMAAVFVRVDRTVDAFLGHMIMPGGSRRTGWATAGRLSGDYALSAYCYDDSPLQTGGCKSDGIAINGGGGITIVNGDVASNQSLKVTQQGGQGVKVTSGDVYLVEGTCGPSSWNCPPTVLGGIQDGSQAVPALFMPHMEVPLYPSPLDGTSTTCTGSNECVPIRPYGSATPGDWSCGGTGEIPCGTWDVTNNACIVPTANDGIPVADGSVSGMTATPAQMTGNLWQNIDEESPDIADYLYGADNQAVEYEALLGPLGTITSTAGMTLDFTVASTHAGVAGVSGRRVDLTVSLWQGTTKLWEDTQANVGTNWTPYSLPLPTVAVSDPNALRVRFDSPASGSSVGRPGAGLGIAFVRLRLPGPPKVGPGYWQSISVKADGGCAVLDPNPAGSPAGTNPSRPYTGLQNGQRPGVFRLSGTNSKPAISLAKNAALFGDRVSIVADKDFSISWAADSALILNATSGIERQAAFAVQPSAAPTGRMAWPKCAIQVSGTDTCVDTGTYDTTIYDPPNNYRGITFYFTPIIDGTGQIKIGDRFYMPNSQDGVSDADYAGIQFMGVMYAPYDNVKITSSADVATVGTILAWTAIFDGQANINLEYPYQRTVGPPFLLEPSVGQH